MKHTLIHSSDPARSAAMFLDPSDNGAIAIVRYININSTRNPLCTIVLFRHAIMGDESTNEQAEIQVSATIHALELAIRTKLEKTSTLRSEDLNRILQSVTDNAETQKTSYSVLTCCLVGNDFSCAGIGNINVWHWHQNVFRPVIEPNLRRVFDTIVLSASLGFGFSADLVQEGQMRLSPDDFVLVTLKAEPSTSSEISNIDDLVSEHPPEKILNQIISRLTTVPSAIAIIRH